jgi:hypothetical protein
MDFGTLATIGLTLAGFSGSRTEDPRVPDMIGPSSASSSGNLLGFIRKGASAYNLMRKGEQQNPAPFETGIEHRESGKYYKRFGKSGITQTSTPEGSPYTGFRNPELNTAIANLMQNAQNTQMKQMIAEYSVQPNLRSARYTQTVEQPSLKTIQV